jgi:hypothetical protein
VSSFSFLNCILTPFKALFNYIKNLLLTKKTPKQHSSARTSTKKTKSKSEESIDSLLKKLGENYKYESPGIIQLGNILLATPALGIALEEFSKELMALHDKCEKLLVARMRQPGSTLDDTQRMTALYEKIALTLKALGELPQQHENLLNDLEAGKTTPLEFGTQLGSLIKRLYEQLTALPKTFDHNPEITELSTKAQTSLHKINTLIFKNVETLWPGISRAVKHILDAQKNNTNEEDVRLLPEAYQFKKALLDLDTYRTKHAAEFTQNKEQDLCKKINALLKDAIKYKGLQPNKKEFDITQVDEKFDITQVDEIKTARSILNLPEEGHLEEGVIQKRFLMCAKSFHPDKHNNSPLSCATFVCIEQAKTLLLAKPKSSH